MSLHKTKLAIHKAEKLQLKYKQQLEEAVNFRNTFVTDCLNKLASNINIDTATIIGGLKYVLDTINNPDDNDLNKQVLEDWQLAGQKFCGYKTSKKSAEKTSM